MVPNSRDIERNGINDEINSDTESFEEISQSDLVELQAHRSPVSETSDTITYGSLSSPTIDNKEAPKQIDISEIDFNVSDCDQSTSQNVNASDFLERYVLGNNFIIFVYFICINFCFKLDSDTETDGTKVPVLKQENSSFSQDSENTIQSKVSSIVSNLRSQISSWVTARRSGAQVFLDRDRQRSIFEDTDFVSPDDPLLNPYLAPDAVLRKFPPVRVLVR